ncbi:hypothetical protein SSPS47_28525 [Streptomyces sp. S4.7]|nr:hypothetical protein SSPS47_28525 [Streptomyces sp. S4.7]
MQLTADQLVVIGRGKLLADTAMADFPADSSQASVRVGVPGADDRRALMGRLAREGAEVAPAGDTELIVTGRTAGEVGDAAYGLGVRLHELRSVSASLEQAYMELTAGSVEYGAGTGTGA